MILWKRGGLALAQLFARGAPRLLTSVIGVGTLIGFGQFWYQNVYLPNRELPVVNVSIKLSTTPVRLHGERVVYVDAAITNPSDHDVTVLGSHFDVAGDRVLASRKNHKGGRPIGWGIAAAREHNLRSGQIVSAGWFLAPGESIAKHVAVTVSPEERVTVGHAYVAMAQATLDSGSLSPRHTHAGPSAVYRVLEVDEHSLWRRYTRGPLRLYTLNAQQDDPIRYPCPGTSRFMWYLAPPDHGPARCSPDSSSLLHRYGADWTDARTELVLGRPGNDANVQATASAGER